MNDKNQEFSWFYNNTGTCRIINSPNARAFPLPEIEQCMNLSGKYVSFLDQKLFEDGCMLTAYRKFMKMQKLFRLFSNEYSPRCKNVSVKMCWGFIKDLAYRETVWMSTDIDNYEQNIVICCDRKTVVFWMDAIL